MSIRRNFVVTQSLVCCVCTMRHDGRCTAMTQQLITSSVCTYYVYLLQRRQRLVSSLHSELRLDRPTDHIMLCWGAPSKSRPIRGYFSA